MIFAENMEVSYKGMCGVIGFICDSYVVVVVPPSNPRLNGARLLVYRENFKNIEVIKDSGR